GGTATLGVQINIYRKRFRAQPCKPVDCFSNCRLRSPSQRILARSRPQVEPCSTQRSTILSTQEAATNLTCEHRAPTVGESPLVRSNRASKPVDHRQEHAHVEGLRQRRLDSQILGF